MIIDTEALKDSVAEFFNKKSEHIKNGDFKDSLKQHLVNSSQETKMQTMMKIQDFEKFVELITQQSENEIKIMR